MRKDLKDKIEEDGAIKPMLTMKATCGAVKAAALVVKARARMSFIVLVEVVLLLSARIR